MVRRSVQLILLLACAGSLSDGAHAQIFGSAEPEAVDVGVAPNYLPSIPLQFLDSAAPYDPATFRTMTAAQAARPAAGAPLSSTAALEAAAADGAAELPLHLTSAMRTHTAFENPIPSPANIDFKPPLHFSNFPAELSAASTDYVPGQAYSMPAAPPGAFAPGPVAPEPRLLAQPPSSNYFPSLPPETEVAFPPYVPGQGPPSYPGMQTSFQPPPSGPLFAEADAFSGVPTSSAAPPRLGLRRPRGRAWVFSAESIFLTEGSKPTGPALISRVDTEAVLVSAPDLTGTWGAGSRMGATRYGERLGFQFNYFGLYNWNRQFSQFDTNNLRLAGDIALASVDFFGADLMTVNYRSNLHNFEFNALTTPDVGYGSFVVGSRFLYLTEQMAIISTDFDSDTSNYKINATNRLYGTHIGWDGGLDSAAGQTQLRLRGGVFMSHASQGQTIYDFGDTFPLRQAGATDNGTSYLGEASLVQCFSPMDGTDIRIGYTLLWIDNIARASTQADMTDTVDSGNTINSDGSIFLHGFSIGAAVSF